MFKRQQVLIKLLLTGFLISTTYGVLGQKTKALSPGSILTGTQTIAYYTVPDSLNATAASGGNCSGIYKYQYQ